MKTQEVLVYFPLKICISIQILPAMKSQTSQPQFKFNTKRLTFSGLIYLVYNFNFFAITLNCVGNLKAAKGGALYSRHDFLLSKVFNTS